MLTTDHGDISLRFVLCYISWLDEAENIVFDSNHTHVQRQILGNKIDFSLTIPSASNQNFQQACGSICGSVEGHRLLPFWETRFWLIQVQLVKWWHVWLDDNSVWA